MDNIKLYTWLVFLLLLLSPFIFQPWIEALEHRQLMIEKHGRLVDAKTSAPLPNATVLFNWREHHHHVGCTPQRATTTDENGVFVLPDISSDVTFHHDLGRSSARHDHPDGLLHGDLRLHRYGLRTWRST